MVGDCSWWLSTEPTYNMPWKFRPNYQKLSRITVSDFIFKQYTYAPKCAECRLRWNKLIGRANVDLWQIRIIPFDTSKEKSWRKKLLSDLWTSYNKAWSRHWGKHFRWKKRNLMFGRWSAIIDQSDLILVLPKENPVFHVYFRFLRSIRFFQSMSMEKWSNWKI